MSSVNDEVSELIGRLTALMVNYPEVEPRISKTVETLQSLLINPERGMQFAIDDLQTLFFQLHRTFERFPELRKDIKPIVELIEHLLGPQ
jgi:hypothetical protein